MSLALLPSELLLLITGQLTPPALLALMLCSRRFFVFGLSILNTHAVNSPYYKTAAIYLAAITANRELLKLLLETGVPIHVIDTTNARQHMVMHLAPSPCTDEILQRTISPGVDLLLSSKASADVAFPALFWAVQYNHLGLLKLALRSGANTEWRSRHDETALHVALRLGNEAIALRLVESGVELTVADGNGNRPLEIAVRKCVGAVEAILRMGADPNRRDRHNATALHHAITAGNEDAVKILLDNRADPNAADVESVTPLHLAAGQPNMGVAARLLLDHGASSLATDRNMKNAFQVAEECGSPVAGFLLERLYHAHPVMRRSDECTFLHLACRNACLPLVRHILGTGITPNVYNKIGQTPLHIAVGNADIEISKLLVNAGAEVEKADVAGDTPLHVAAKLPDLSLFWELLLLGGRVCFSVRNNKGHSPLHLAARTIADPKGVFEVRGWYGEGAERGRLWDDICQAERVLFGEVLERRRALGL